MTTPAKVIKDECRWCKNGNQFTCESEVCALNNNSLSSLKRIRSHCLDCVQTTYEVTACEGNVILPTPHKCHLWGYRSGKNPKRKGKGGKGVRFEKENKC